jgi:hypothetical protein
MLLATLGSAIAMPVSADDWVASKLRGVVLTLVDGQWVKLERGQTVPDDRVIRTLKTGRVVFQRGAETIELGGDTQVQIFDRSGKRFTTVKQYFGTVGVEAEVQNVQHFGVQTPYLAAVVKGTKFVVTSDEDGARVDVKRGQVAVQDSDTNQSTLVAAGQSVETSSGAPLDVSGKGELPDVVDARGRVVASSETNSQRLSVANSGDNNTDSSSNTRSNGTGVSNGNANGNGNGNANGNGGSNGNGNGNGNGGNAASNGNNGNSGNSEGDSEADDGPGRSDDNPGRGRDKHDD